ncbi:MAG: DNA polymerase III subunit chi [Pseudomonadota bacterium]|nr:DNA polymerase III subunit chi [Pseudomonadota bacterium]
MTTEVEFHTGIADPVDFVCRLLRKAYRKGARVLVTAPAPLLSELDAALWAFEPAEFVPHLRQAGMLDSRPAELAARTPIWLSESPLPSTEAFAAPRVVVNVGAAAHPRPAELERLIEIVGVDPAAVEQGRGRWRDYRAAGLQVIHHNARQAAVHERG